MSAKTMLASLLTAGLLVALPTLRVHSESAPADAPAAEAGASQLQDAGEAAPSELGEVIFPHDEHTDEMEVECEECHHETNAASLEFPHPELFADFWVDCRICHHEPDGPELEPQACSDCHRAAADDAADETLSAKVVIHKLCWECHEIGVGAEASEACEYCHTEP